MNYLPIDYGCVAANQVKKNIRDCVRQESEFLQKLQKESVLEQILLELTGKIPPTTDNLIDLDVPTQSRQAMALDMAQNIIGMSPLLQDSSRPEPTIFDIINMQVSEEEEGLTEEELREFYIENADTDFELFPEKDGQLRQAELNRIDEIVKGKSKLNKNDLKKVREILSNTV